MSGERTVGKVNKLEKENELLNAVAERNGIPQK
jgi:hypothetical protein